VPKNPDERVPKNSDERVPNILIYMKECPKILMDVKECPKTPHVGRATCGI